MTHCLLCSLSLSSLPSLLSSLSLSLSQDELLDLVDTLNRDSFVDGLLVQLPLPSHINEMTICQAIDPYKDVDGFHLINIGKSPTTYLFNK